eukprot:2165174-Amphidinium_carterae.1
MQPNLSARRTLGSEEVGAMNRSMRLEVPIEDNRARHAPPNKIKTNLSAAEKDTNFSRQELFTLKLAMKSRTKL